MDASFGLIVCGALQGLITGIALAWLLPGVQVSIGRKPGELNWPCCLRVDGTQKSPWCKEARGLLLDIYQQIFYSQFPYSSSLNILSPARIGTFRRFSVGVSGQDQLGL
jgi:hypothetical protein